ncbi:MAG: hypothetical protein ABR499_11145 [Gemmatimonadaceae bacterium]
MEREGAATVGAVPTAPGDAGGGDPVFGTRQSTDRPHSLSLSAAGPTLPHGGATRGADVLLGVGIGAAIMYYLDPDGGARRRARIRDTVVRALTMAPDTFKIAAQEVAVASRPPLAHARGRPPSGGPAGDDRADGWTPRGRIVATTVGSALTLLAARRRDALGAAVALVGSALLARGVARTHARRDVPLSGVRHPEVASEPAGSQVGHSL